MQHDHLIPDLRAAMALAEEYEAPEGTGPGFLVYRLAQDVHALCCLCGPEEAQREIEEIVNSEFDRKRTNG